jgi:prophage DNA circulation protein
MATEDGVFGNYAVGKWSVGGRPEIFLPIVDISETGGNRIVPHERPYRDGAKLDDTGSKARSWSLTVVFNNNIDEPGIPDKGQLLYPFVLKRLMNSALIHETGTLTLPTIGDVRARFSEYARRETPEQNDSATVTLTFTEDNEDAFDRATLQPPTVIASLVRLSETTTFTAQSIGVWSSDLASLRERCNELVTLMKAPGRSVADVATVARANRRAIASVLETARTEIGRLGVFSEPRSSGLHQQLATLADRQAAAEDERSASRPPTRPYVVEVERTSIFEVAAAVGQDAEELLDLNAARVADPFDIERGDVLKVFAA